jgi:hypothetical protein
MRQTGGTKTKILQIIQELGGFGLKKVNVNNLNSG